MTGQGEVGYFVVLEARILEQLNCKEIKGQLSLLVKWLDLAPLSLFP